MIPVETIEHSTNGFHQLKEIKIEVNCIRDEESRNPCRMCSNLITGLSQMTFTSMPSSRTVSVSRTPSNRQSGPTTGNSD